MRKKSSSGSWRTRTHGSGQQVGSKFQLRTTSMQGARANLPRITGHPRGSLTVTQPERVVRLALTKVNVKDLIFRESNRPEIMPKAEYEADLNHRARYFLKLYQEHGYVPPILVHRDPKTGKTTIMDGHARARAAQWLGIKELPAVENSILSSLGAGAKKFGHAITSGAKTAAPYAKRALKFGEKAASHVGQVAEEGLTQAGRISRAYHGEVAPREELEHEERVAEIRARREPIQRERVREVVVTGSGPFGGTSSPLLSQPMLQEVRRSKWRVHRVRSNPKQLEKKRNAREQREKIKERIKKGFRSLSEYAKAPTPSIYRLRKKREEE